MAKPDGVRALKRMDLARTLNDLFDGVPMRDVLGVCLQAAAYAGLALGSKERALETFAEVIDIVQSANAGKPRPASDSPEERQHKNKPG